MDRCLLYCFIFWLVFRSHSPFLVYFLAFFPFATNSISSNKRFFIAFELPFSFFSLQLHLEALVFPLHRQLKLCVMLSNWNLLRCALYSCLSIFFCRSFWFYLRANWIKNDYLWVFFREELSYHELVWNFFSVNLYFLKYSSMKLQSIAMPLFSIIHSFTAASCNFLFRINIQNHSISTCLSFAIVYLPVEIESFHF